jgi:hypothetical protein
MIEKSDQGEITPEILESFPEELKRVIFDKDDRKIKSYLEIRLNIKYFAL